MAAVHDFNEEHPTSSVTLIIGEKKLYVSSEVLAMHSHFFRSVLFKEPPKTSGEEGDAVPNLIRTDLKEVRLDNVDIAQFVDLLNIIYPSDHPITDQNVEYILELTDKYHFNVVKNECEQHLSSTSTKLEKVTRMRLADRYHLSDLVDKLVKELTKEEIGALMKGKVSNRTQTALINHLTA